MKELKQRKNFVKRELRFTDSKLFYNVSKFGYENEVDIPFEGLNGEKVSYKRSIQALLITLIMLYSIAIIAQIAWFFDGNVQKFSGLFWAGIATVMHAVYWLTRENLWKIRLANGQYIYLHKNIPSKVVTEQFLSELMESRNEYLKENYAIIDENLNYGSQLHNLKWLKSINAISKEEFGQKYAELKNTIKRTIKPDNPNIDSGE